MGQRARWPTFGMCIPRRIARRYASSACRSCRSTRSAARPSRVPASAAVTSCRCAIVARRLAIALAAHPARERRAGAAAADRADQVRRRLLGRRRPQPSRGRPLHRPGRDRRGRPGAAPAGHARSSTPSRSRRVLEGSLDLRDAGAGRLTRHDGGRSERLPIQLANRRRRRARRRDDAQGQADLAQAAVPAIARADAPVAPAGACRTRSSRPSTSRPTGRRSSRSTRSSAAATSSPTTSTSWPTRSTCRCSTCAAITTVAATGKSSSRPACRAASTVRVRGDQAAFDRGHVVAGRHAPAGGATDPPRGSRHRPVRMHSPARQPADDHPQPRAATRPGRHARGPLPPRLRGLPLAVPTRLKPVLWLHGHTSLAARPDWRRRLGPDDADQRDWRCADRDRRAIGRMSAVTRILLYTGKGGVGKTSVAAATAVAVRPARAAHPGRLDRHRAQPGRRARHAGRPDAARRSRPTCGPTSRTSSSTSRATGARSRRTSRACSPGAASTR